MKPPQFDYIAADSVDAAVEAKSAYEGEASILAGGQSLVPMLNFRLARPAALIDITRIAGLDAIQVDGDVVCVGATVRQRDLERHAEAAAVCPVIPRALEHVAHPVIRNRGTVGGSIAHAEAAAELPATLTALDGRVRVRGRAGERTIAAAELFEFHLTTSLEPDEVIVEVELPGLGANGGCAFMEVARRHGDYALAGVCAIVHLAADETIVDARLAYAGIAPTPVRAADAERALVGQRPSAEVFRDAGEAAVACVDAIDEQQATVAYRCQLVRTLTVRALGTACTEARGRAVS